MTDPEPGPVSGGSLVPPHGGVLVDLLLPEATAVEGGAGPGMPSLVLSAAQTCDLELLATGAFSPLAGFLGAKDHASVCASMRLASGLLWPVPVVLEIPTALAARLRPGSSLRLLDKDGTLLAVQHVEEKWRRDRRAEARAVFGTTERAHPGVAALLRGPDGCCVAGPLEVLRLPAHSDFRRWRLTPVQLRRQLQARGGGPTVAFQTRNPMHRAHLELTVRASRDAQAHILLHPVVGVTKPGDVDYRIRVRCYEALLPCYPPGAATLSLLPLAMRMAGPREAVWHAIVRKNFGASHLIVGRDHAGPGLDPAGLPFYPPYAAQDLVRRHEVELGITMMSYPELVYVAELDRYVTAEEVPPGGRGIAISGTEQRRRLASGEELPPWFTPAPVAAQLRAAFPPAKQPAAAAGRHERPVRARSPQAAT